MTIAAAVAEVRARVERAARRSGRSGADVTLVAAAKTQSAASVAEAALAGVADVGENYVQEGLAKRLALASQPLRWHLIGHLQRNKARAAVAHFDLIQSVDSLRLATALHRAAEAAGRVLPCLMEVNLRGEASKSGVAPDRADELFEQMSALSALRVEGLMAIPPPVADAEASRPDFARLRELRERIDPDRRRLRELSMGMSADFEVAIEEGATMVRVGTGIFGARRAPAVAPCGPDGE